MESLPSAAVMPPYPVSNVVKLRIKHLTLLKQIERFNSFGPFHVCRPMYTNKFKTFKINSETS